MRVCVYARASVLDIAYFKSQFAFQQRISADDLSVVVVVVVVVAAAVVSDRAQVECSTRQARLR